MKTQIYPSTRYETAALRDLSSRAERERLSSAALSAFFNIMRHWEIRDADARQLLGGISNGPYYQLKKDPGHKVLEADVLVRISYLIGIFKALNSLHGEKLADQWVQLPNANRIFAGSTPLEYMIRGGVEGMQNVRRLLDARVQGA
jgi:Antitoxin Xre/MbcA/ParS C-terminal toxin-binding domain